MKDLNQWIKLMILALFCWNLTLQAQSIDRPIIWATDAERATMLSRIDQYDWAASFINTMKSVVDAKVYAHITSPVSILNTIPAFASDDNLSESAASSANSGHAKVTQYAAYSAMLYYLTQDEKYAQFSADIVSYYVDAMVDVPVDKMATSGAYFYDARTSYGNFAIAYDFIYDFLTRAGTEVYVKSTGQKVAFDNAKAQRMIEKLASNALQEHSGSDTHGRIVSNHPILRAPGTLFCVLIVDDDTERERLFNVFWEKGTKNQNSFKNTILPMFGAQGIWPESLSYGFMPAVSMVLNMIDRIKPEMNVTQDYMHVLEGNFLFDYLRTPNRKFVRYGDSKRKTDQTSDLYQYTLNIAKRRGYTDLEEKALVALRQNYNASGGFNPVVSTSTFYGFSTFPDFFWALDVPQQISEGIDFEKPTVIIEHAGVALQRNSVSSNNKEYGLCGIIGGAHYVHSHVTGITMELYGRGYVMGPNAGLCATLAERSEPEHTDYFRLYAGNNTVIVNGTSRGIQDGAWNSNSYLWMNTTRNIAAEPAHLQDPVSENFSFATQFLDDNVNNCDQQRTLSTIRTSATTGYYFDMFRSKALGTNNYHDYVYHNIGDEMHIMDADNRTIAVSATDKYQTYYNDPVKSPGWRFFENTQETAPTAQAVHIRFDVDDYSKYMNVFAPAGIERAYTKAMGPATREAPGDYLERKTPILAIRQQGEAWDKPFVHVFEPTASVATSVRNVVHIMSGEQIVGAKVTSELESKTVEDYILCLPDGQQAVSLGEMGIDFRGRFAVVRFEYGATSTTTLYIGEGDSLSFGDFKLNAGDARKGVQVFDGAPYFGRQLLITSPRDNAELPLGSNITVEAVVGGDFIETALWLNDTLNLGTKTQAPYVWSDLPVLNNIQEELYQFTLIAKDADGELAQKTIVVSTPGQEPNTTDGKPHPIPGRIQFEDYDFGGIDIGYFDLSEQSSKYTYRDTDVVDLGLSGTVVSSIEPGEWLEYTVNAEQAGFYTLKVKHSSILFPSVKSFSLVNMTTGDTLLQHFNGLFTGYYTFFEDEAGLVYLEQGEQDLRVAILNEGADLDYMNFEFNSSAYRVNVTAEHGSVSLDSNQNYYPNNSNLSVEAIPDEGYRFVSWSGDYTSTDNPLDITINSADVHLTAIFESTSALSTVVRERVHIYPNPSKGIVSLELEDEMNASFEVCSLSGRVVMQGEFISQTHIDLSTQRAGIYIIKINTDKGYTVERIVLE